MVEVHVCIGSACHIKGSYNIIQTFQQLIEEQKLHEKVEFKATFCMKNCGCNGVSVSVNGQNYNIDPSAAKSFFTSTVLPEVK